MKDVFKNIGYIIGAIFLIIIAFIIIILLTPFALVWLIYVSITEKRRRKRDIVMGTAIYFIAVASSMDKFGNCAFGGFFNWALLKEGKHEFGNNSETVSIVLGWAYKHNDLNKLGLDLRRFVNWIDFTVEDHCEHSRMLSIENAKKIILEYDLLISIN